MFSVYSMNYSMIDQILYVEKTIASSDEESIIRH